MSNDKPPYAVGYGKPPAATRFKAGQSGNPRGRPKGSKNITTAMEEELNATVAIIDNGKRRRLSKRQLIAKQLITQSAAGDLKAMSLVLNEIRLHEKKAPEKSTDEEVPSPEEQKTIASILRRICERELGISPAEPDASEPAPEPSPQDPQGER